MIGRPVIRDLDALLVEIEARAQRPFRCGNKANDCGSYVAACVKAQTGRNPFVGMRWTTQRGLARMLKRRGGIEAAVSSRLRPIAPSLAMRGDVAGWIDSTGEMGLMIVEGDMLVGPGRLRTMRLPRSRMVRAWSATQDNSA